MSPKSLETDIITKRINGIQSELNELNGLAKLPFKQFENGVEFKLAQYHLHRALEGVFNISAHILSCIPGAQATEYKEMARNLGKYGIVGKKFADETLTKMAGYRNRLVHFYAEITPKETYNLINHNLKDFDAFLSAVKNLLENPSKFNLSAG